MIQQVIIGLHSIAEAVRNPRRELIELVASEDGLKELREKESLHKDELAKLKVSVVHPHKVQELAKSLIEESGFHYSRIPSGCFLITKVLDPVDLAGLYEMIEKKPDLRLLALDQVTDAHNGAAILRTASFYGVDAVIFSSKGNFGESPSFTRIASGALESVPLVRCGSLPQALKKIQDRGITLIGLSEHAAKAVGEMISPEARYCLVLGAEDVGLSNAVKRLVTETFALRPRGQTKSLNVSVAAAIAMEMVFGQG